MHPAPTASHAFERTEREERALEKYAELATISHRIEPHCRYAILLEHIGRNQEAAREFAQIKKRVGRMGPDARQDELHWIETASKH